MFFLQRLRVFPAAAALIRFESGYTELQDVLENKIVASRKEVIAFKKEHGKTVIDQITVNQVIGGMRDLKVLISMISAVDPIRGILWRGKTIPEIIEILPRVGNTNAVFAEGLLWFLLTGDCPTEQQNKCLSEELERRKNLPKTVECLLTRFDCYIPPMVQLSAAVTLMSAGSKYREEYDKGAPKLDLWKHVLDDSLDLIANLPEITALIYAHTYKNGELNLKSDTPDWAGKFADVMGFNSDSGRNLMRLHMFLHCDHDLGPVSSHAVHLVGSAHADPFLSFASGLNGLAGPLHGNAARDSFVLVLKIREQYGDGVTEDQIKAHIEGMLKKRQVIPGFGHARLRMTDPRYTEIRKFCMEHFPEDPVVQIAEKMREVVTPLIKHKAANPYPNVDAYSGVAWHCLGLKDLSVNTLLFGVARSLGSLSQLVWDRALLLPIERPTCVNMDELMECIEHMKVK